MLHFSRLLRDGAFPRPSFLTVVVRYHLRHFPACGQFHEFRGASSFLICVVKDDAVDAPEHILKMKVKIRIGFQASLKVGSQVCLA